MLEGIRRLDAADPHQPPAISARWSTQQLTLRAFAADSGVTTAQLASIIEHLQSHILRQSLIGLSLIQCSFSTITRRESRTRCEHGSIRKGIQMLVRRAVLSALAWVVIVETFILFDALPTVGAKEPPKVRFDASSGIACRTVASNGTAMVDSGSKLIQAQFRISILVSEGNPEDVEDVLLRVESPQHRLRVVDFSPKTEMANTVEGDVQTTHTSERTTTAGAQIGGGALPTPFSLASATLGASQRNVVAQTFKEPPSKCLVLASGTIDGEHGVFFKIKGAPQVPLEGAKEFTCTFEVPKEWRGGWCLLSCHARGLNEHCLGKKIEPCGNEETFIGLYLAGDDEAQLIVGRLDRFRLQQPVGNTERQTLGLPTEMAQSELAIQHKPLEFTATLISWAKLPGLVDRSPFRSDSDTDHIDAALRQTLAELSDLACR
jgi:hypothetical protein